MQSFIINIPDEKVDFFLELADMLDFEVLEIEEDEFIIEEDEQDEPPVSPPASKSNKKAPGSKKEDSSSDNLSNDPFLDWDAERQNAKKNKY